MKKYLARTDYSSLGSVHETKEQAEQQATAYRDWNDDVTGYYKVFGEHASEPRPIAEMEDVVPTREEYVRSLAEFEEEKKRFDEEVERMRKQRFEKFFDIQRRYINLGTSYNHHDLIKVTYRKPTGRKHSVIGIVCDVWISPIGEIRPKIGKVYDKAEEEIVSIEVLKSRNEMDNREIFRKLHRLD